MSDLELANILTSVSKELSCKIRPIPTFSDEYFASSHGQIFSFKGRRWKELSPHEHWRGYRFVTLYKDLRRQQYKIHRLVLWSFVGPSTLQVNHINGVKSDNRLENLEYSTASENARHAYETGLRNKYNNQPSGKDHWTQKLVLPEGTVMFPPIVPPRPKTILRKPKLNEGDISL